MGTGTGLMPVWLDVDGRVGSGERGPNKERKVLLATGREQRQEGAGLCTPPLYTPLAAYRIV